MMSNGMGYYSSPYGPTPVVSFLNNFNQASPPAQPPYYCPPCPQPNNEQNYNNPSLFKLYDFDTNDQSDIIRLIFSFAGVLFKDKHVKQAEWDRVKDHIPVRQLPILRVNNRFKIYYFDAILRYLAREFNLYGIGNVDHAIVDMIIEANGAFREELFEQINNSTSIEQRKIILSQFINTHARNYLNQLEEFYEIFNRPGLFYLGSEISLADLIVYQTIHYLIDINWNLLDDYPNLKKAHHHLENHPQLTDYLNSKKNIKTKAKRHVTLSPTSNNFHHHYQRHRSHEARKPSHRYRQQSKEPLLLSQTKPEPKSFNIQPKGKRPLSPLKTKQESRPLIPVSKEQETMTPLQTEQQSELYGIRLEEKEITPSRTTEVIPQSPRVGEVISQRLLVVEIIPPPPAEIVPNPPPPAEIIPQPPRAVEVIPQPPRVAEVVPQPPPPADVIPQPPRLAEVIPQPPRVADVIPQPPRVAEVIQKPPPPAEVIPPPTRVVEVIPQPPPVVEVIPKPPPPAETVPQPPRVSDVIPQPPPPSTVVAKEKSENIDS
jgi:glutathione S-transferase